MYFRILLSYNMNNIFQIFYQFDKPLEEFPIFLKSIEKWKNYVSIYDGTYKLYLQSDCERIIDNSKYADFYYSLCLWSKMEFMRYVIVEQTPNSIYIDLDIVPNYYDKFNELQKGKYLFGIWDNKDNSSKGGVILSNSIIGLQDNSVISGFIEYAMKEHERMNLMPIYGTWKIRKMKRGVGVNSFQKYFKKEYPVNTDLSYCIKDYACKSWLVEKNRDLLY